MALPVVLAALTPLIEQLISHIPDPAARREAQSQAEATLLSLLGQQQQGQVEVNKVEAASSSLFVSGWRPFIGWVCGASLVYTYIVAPFWAWVLVVWYPSAALPTLPSDNLFELVLAMLGLGGLRTFEKIKGIGG